MCLQLHGSACEKETMLLQVIEPQGRQHFAGTGGALLGHAQIQPQNAGIQGQILDVGAEIDGGPISTSVRQV
jgi:hypothetical protein